MKRRIVHDGFFLFVNVLPVCTKALLMYILQLYTRIYLMMELRLLTFFFFIDCQLKVRGTINRKLMPEITYLPVQSTQIQYTYSYTWTRLYGSAPEMVYVASSWQDFSTISAEDKCFSNLGKRGSKKRFINCTQELANPSRWQN